MGFHAIEAFFPGSNMLVYPRFGRMQGVRFELAGSNPPDFLGADQPALLEDLHMFEQRWQSQFERLRKLADGFRPLAQTTDDRPPGRICERGKGAVQIG